MMTTSMARISNTTIQLAEGYISGRKIETGFFIMYLGSRLELTEGTSIQNLSATKFSAIQANSQSEVHILNGVIFRGNTATSRNGVLIGLHSCGLTSRISDAYFERNGNTDISAESSPLSIINSNFTQSTGSHVVAFMSQLTMQNVRMYNSSGQGADGLGLQCNYCFNVSISDSYFEALEANRGGAIQLNKMTDDSLSVISNNTFISNEGIIAAGAIDLHNPGRVIITDNTFTNNSAAANHNSNTVHEGDAGAIYYSCRPTEQQTCDVALENNTFRENSARSRGGALRWVNKNFTSIEEFWFNSNQTANLSISDTQEADQNDTTVQRRLDQLIEGSANNTTTERIDTNIYIDNEAPYGRNQASYPKAILQSISAETKEEYHLESGSNETHIQIVPGQKMQLNLTLTDQEDRLYSEEYHAIAEVNFSDGQDLAPGSTMNSNVAIARHGTLDFEQLQIFMKPNSTAMVVVTLRNMDDYGNNLIDGTTLKQFVLNARPCINGEAYKDELACERCPFGSYSYEVMEEPGQCKVCPDEAYCYGGDKTSPKAMYWRTEPYSDNFMTCLCKDHCLAGDESRPLGVCQEGYTGMLCAVCEENYFREGIDSCSKCYNTAFNIILKIVSLAIFITFIVYIVRVIITSLGHRKPIYITYIKIFFNHFQMLYLIGKIDFTWPWYIESLIKIQYFFVTTTRSLLSFDCLIMSRGEPSLSLVFINNIILTALPLLVIGISYIFWNIFAHSQNANDRKDKHFATVSVVLFFLYPHIVTTLAESLVCTDVDGVYRLNVDITQECYTGQHFWFSGFVIMPTLAIWMIVLPGFIASHLYRCAEDLQTSNYNSDRTKFHAMERSFRMKYGFFMAGYRDRTYFWEVLIHVRKTIFVWLIVLLIPRGAGAHSPIIMIFLTAFVILQLLCSPYYEPDLNIMELLSYSVLLFIVYCGLYFQTNLSSEYEGIQRYSMFLQGVGRGIIFIVLFIAFFAFFGYFFRKMWFEMLNLCSQHNHEALFKIISCYQISIKKFREQNTKLEEGSDLYQSDQEIDEKDDEHGLHRMATFNKDFRKLTRQITKQFKNIISKPGDDEDQSESEESPFKSVKKDAMKDEKASAGSKEKASAGSRRKAQLINYNGPRNLFEQRNDKPDGSSSRNSLMQFEEHSEADSRQSTQKDEEADNTFVPLNRVRLNNSAGGTSNMQFDLSGQMNVMDRLGEECFYPKIMNTHSDAEHSLDDLDDGQIHIEGNMVQMPVHNLAKRKSDSLQSGLNSNLKSKNKHRIGKQFETVVEVTEFDDITDREPQSNKSQHLNRKLAWNPSHHVVEDVRPSQEETSKSEKLRPLTYEDEDENREEHHFSDEDNSDKLERPIRIKNVKLQVLEAIKQTSEKEDEIEAEKEVTLAKVGGAHGASMQMLKDIGLYKTGDAMKIMSMKRPQKPSSTLVDPLVPNKKSFIKASGARGESMAILQEMMGMKRPTGTVMTVSDPDSEDQTHDVVKRDARESSPQHKTRQQMSFKAVRESSKKKWNRLSKVGHSEERPDRIQSLKVPEERKSVSVNSDRSAGGNIFNKKRQGNKRRDKRKNLFSEMDKAINENEENN